MSRIEKILNEFVRQTAEARVKDTAYSESSKSYNEGLEDAKSILINIIYDEVTKEGKNDKEVEPIDYRTTNTETNIPKPDIKY